MEIIKNNYDSGPFTREITCGHCRSRLRIGEKDLMRRVTRDYSLTLGYGVDCPVCKHFTDVTNVPTDVADRVKTKIIR